ncbi:alpha-L-rhamnosidase [Pedobacter panaciterrae]|jgi:Glycogen debranching enzyme|uniref:alpha-L-rhamnosidase-related protein n=1 Tax=Pedobacter panaciterrae TaxID=363849 RepID=UPI00155D8B25|nr:alpha-L-rhamnosidase C-terminal domain-containing protein [Pedobacter panaciterrae]NQX52158.1 alpha-L-rhamnosidase [Pedobacter panaciterrae]
MNYLIRSFCFIIVLFISISCFSQTERWQAEWIGIPHAEKDTNLWTSFRKQVSIDKIPNKVLTKISTDSKYWLWVNGKMIVFEGQLKRGPNPRDTYYDEINLAPYLTKGKNTISILTWYWGRDGYDHKNSGKSALLYDMTIGNNVIISNSTWKVMRHPAFGNTSAPLPNYRLPEFNIYFDAQKDMPLWNQPDFDDHSWVNATSYGKPPVSPWNNLVKRPIPFWKDSGLLHYTNNANLPKVSDGNPIVAKLPKNISITPYLKIDAPAGLKIDIRTDNYKGGSEYNVRTEYITKAGIQEFETFGYLNGHEVHYSVPKDVKIIDLKYRETRYDTEQIGKFKSDDPFYNRLWEKSYNTLNVNLRDAIQDPDRERAQWWGDAVILMGEILYACDRNGELIINKAIRNLVDWRKPDGVLYSPVPAGSWHGELPAQMLASVGKYGFWNYYRYTGDTALIRHVYPTVKNYLQLWRLGDDGLVIHRPGGWDWMDWGEDIDTPLLENAWYYMAVETAVKMAELTGNQSDIKAYQELLKSIKINFNRKFWSGSAYKSPTNKGVIDDRGNGLAVLTGLADSGKYEAIKNVLKTEFHASPYMEKYIMESFFIMHDAKGGLGRMKKRYANMVESHLTTLWEGWGIGSEGYGGGSYNHGWSGGPLTLLIQYVAGIAPEETAYKTISILPQPGNLHEIYCVTPTVEGNITVDLKRRDNKLTFFVDIPPNTLAKIGLPKMESGLSNISLNGKLFVKNKKSLKKHPEVIFKGEDVNYFLFDVKPGKWSFVLY